MAMQGGYEEISCPFCDKGRIKALHIPSVWSEKVKKTATFGSTKKLSKSPDILIIQSGCNVCGKSQKDIEKALKEDKKDVDKEKRILERLREQGFSGEITTKF
jgi:hypothetical protein